MSIMVSDRGQVYMLFEGAVLRVFCIRLVLDRRFLFTKGNAHQIIFKFFPCRSAFSIYPWAKDDLVRKYYSRKELFMYSIFFGLFLWFRPHRLLTIRECAL
jgi:hypothetical protein